MQPFTFINNIIFSSSKEEETPLSNTRERIIRLSFVLAISLCVLLIIVRSINYNENQFLIFAAGLALMLSVGFLYLCIKGYSQTIILIANSFYIIIAFYEGYQLDMPLQTFIYFSLIPAITLFLVESRKIRFIFLGANLLIFIVLHLLTETDTISNLFTYVLMAVICYIVLVAFVELMEQQQNDLVLTMKGKTEALQLLEDKHQDLLLFNNMMNHDIKAPLRSIKGFSFLLGKTQMTKEQKEYLDFISTSANNLEHLISDLMLYNKMNVVELKLEDTDISFIIDSISLSLKYDIQQKNVQIVKKDLPEYIFGSSDGLRTVFQNLISNSIKYQPKNIENHIPKIVISYKEEEDFDVIYVDDNGIGIKEDNIEKLFTPFVRFHSASEYEGTGLGLSICKKIVEKHNGSMEFEPKQAQGTRFRLSFPKK